jgi:hypothetical protein
VTKSVLFELLKQKSREIQTTTDFECGTGFKRDLHLIMKRTNIGNQVVWVEPYWFADANVFGLLMDFKFDLKEGVDRERKAREIQQFSLSLTSSGRKNLDFYGQRHTFIKQAASRIVQELFPITFQQFQITCEDRLSPIRAVLLPRKKYQVGGAHLADSPFHGIKEYGPFQEVSAKARFHFLFRDEDRDLALQLYKALKGETFPSLFDGLENHFRLPFSNDIIGHKRLANLSGQEIRKSLEEIAREEGRPAIVLPIFPSDEILYFRFKRDCLELGLLEQVTTIPLLRNKEKLKWSIANIGLGIFTKLGGIPWLMSSASNRLIVGVGQALRTVGPADNREIKRFFSYSVLTEATGRYISLEVLANSDNHNNYIIQLGEGLKNLLLTNGKKYDEIVLHVPYTIKKDLIAKLKETIDSASEQLGSKVLLSILRINTKNKFFGYNEAANSMVPLEGTLGILSKTDFLGWYSGLDRLRPIVNRQIPGPVFVSLYYSSRLLTENEQYSLLDDLNNLAAANWRGFNGKVTPVSIYYCKIVADLIEKFDELSLGHLPNISYLKPWFL